MINIYCFQHNLNISVLKYTGNLFSKIILRLTTPYAQLLGLLISYWSKLKSRVFDPEHAGKGNLAKDCWADKNYQIYLPFGEPNKISLKYHICQVDCNYSKTPNLSKVMAFAPSHKIIINDQLDNYSSFRSRQSLTQKKKSENKSSTKLQNY